MKEKTPPKLSAREHAMNFLARREHSYVELVQKLINRGHEADDAYAAVDRLMAQGLQNDERFVEAYVRSRALSGCGPIKIKAELNVKGVSKELISLFLYQDNIPWNDLLATVWQKKFTHKPQHGDARGYAKQVRFLLQRGFSPESVRMFLAQDFTC